MRGNLRLAASSAHGESGDDPEIRVVLADDHVAARRSLRRLLDRERDLTVVSESGDLATVFEHVDRHGPHVLVLDIRTPSGSTFEAIRKLRARTTETEIVVLSMNTSSAFAEEALRAGALGYVLKERSDNDLAPAIRAAVRGDEWVSQPVVARLAALRAAEQDGLTGRELEIVRLVALGFTSAEIGCQLKLSARTVESHRSRIHRKLGLTTRAELVAYALGRHLIDT